MSLSNQEIIQLITGYEKDARAIREEALKMAWFMRGGITYAEAMQLSFHDREIIGGIIKDNMKTTKESGLPFF